MKNWLPAMCLLALVAMVVCVADAPGPGSRICAVMMSALALWLLWSGRGAGNVRKR